MFWPPLGIGEPGIMEVGMEVILVGKLLLAEAWGVSGAGPGPWMMGIWGCACITEAPNGATGGSVQASCTIKLAACSRAPALDGGAMDLGPV